MAFGLHQVGSPAFLDWMRALYDEGQGQNNASHRAILTAARFPGMPSLRDCLWLQTNPAFPSVSPSAIDLLATQQRAVSGGECTRNPHLGLVSSDVSEKTVCACSSAGSAITVPGDVTRLAASGR